MKRTFTFIAALMLMAQANAAPIGEQKAKEMSEQEARRFLSAYCHRTSQAMMDEWNQLAQLLIVKYNDMTVKRTDEDGRFLKTPGGNQVPVQRPGYPLNYRRKIIQEVGTRYQIK